MPKKHSINNCNTQQCNFYDFYDFIHKSREVKATNAFYRRNSHFAFYFKFRFIVAMEIISFITFQYHSIDMASLKYRCSNGRVALQFVD